MASSTLRHNPDRHAGYDVGRDQVARQMRAAGIAGVRRGKQIKTTKADPAAARHPDLVNRTFTATAPNQLWIGGSDLGALDDTDESLPLVVSE